MKQRNLTMNWSKIGGESFSDKDVNILKRIMEGGNIPDDDADLFSKEIKFDEGEQEVLETAVLLKQQVQVPWYIIRFDSRFRVYWDLFIIFLAVYNCILIPIDVGFGSKFYGSNKLLIQSIDGSLDVFFLLDFIFNFMTTFISPKTGHQVVQCSKISKAYINSWSCYIDLLATIPFDRIVYLMVQDSSVNLSFFGVLKMVRLLRLRRIVTFLKVNSGMQFSIRLV
jgi:hypothetical protein